MLSQKQKNIDVKNTGKQQGEVDFNKNSFFAPILTVN
jgi:hypothetical protein